MQSSVAMIYRMRRFCGGPLDVEHMAVVFVVSGSVVIRNLETAFRENLGNPLRLVVRNVIAGSSEVDDHSRLRLALLGDFDALVNDVADDGIDFLVLLRNGGRGDATEGVCIV